MTRINLIPVEELTDQHLLAEHREIKRVPNLILKGKYSLKNQPTKYVLGAGHVKFFYDKLDFLFDRYIDLYNECKKREFKVKCYMNSFSPLFEGFFNKYTPTKEDVVLSRQRIDEKIKAKPGFYRYKGKLI